MVNLVPWKYLTNHFFVSSGGPAPEDSDASEQSKPSYFTGSGYTLGSEEEPSVLVNDASAAEAATESLPSVRNYGLWGQPLADFCLCTLRRCVLGYKIPDFLEKRV